MSLGQIGIPVMMFSVSFVRICCVRDFYAELRRLLNAAIYRRYGFTVLRYNVESCNDSEQYHLKVNLLDSDAFGKYAVQ